MPTRIGIIAPMGIELQPIVRALTLHETAPNAWRGHSEDIEVIAMMSSIGMHAARETATAMVGYDVDHIMVVGIAGGVTTAVAIGSVIAPELVVDRLTGRRYVPSFVGGGAVGGTLSCGDDLITDHAVLAGLANDGVIALDMETAAVADVCVSARRPWSVWRSISDHPGAGMIDSDLMSMTLPDGSADPVLLQRLLDDPIQRARLEQLAVDADIAVRAAADAAIAAIPHIAAHAGGRAGGAGS